ncbi:MAG: molybdenum cofactor guanylyltransferase [Deltaproteobacteria bacterium]|nr:molybdenum cofactor guanylyltransferase [Deltaproteobacteria bacterium]
MPKINDVTGVILAGGRSSRFGTNKALALFQGIPLIDRVLNVMSPLFHDLMIVTNTPEIYERLHLPLVKDFEPYLGPLGGIYTALRETRNDRIFVVGCDMPLLDPKVISGIIQKSEEADAVVPIHDGIREFLMAVYSRKLLPEICKSLGEGRLSVKELCFHIPCIEWIPVKGDSWTAINTAEELKKLEERYAR